MRVREKTTLKDMVAEEKTTTNYQIAEPHPAANKLTDRERLKNRQCLFFITVFS